MPSIKNLEEALVDELRDIYSAEKQLVRAIPKLAKNASSPELRSVLEKHTEQTRQQAQRLEQIFERLGQSARARKCEGMTGIIEEGEELLKRDAEPHVRDAAIVGLAQKVEHYEIAAYGTVCTWCQELQQHEVLDLLKQTLAEEKQTDADLTEIAKKGVNRQASQPEQGREAA